MFNLTIFFIFQSILLVTLVFWLLSIIGEKFFKDTNMEASKEVFECGFFAIHKLNLSFNFSFFLLGLLLILYDIEFFFLIPGFFNWNLMGFAEVWFGFIFLTLILFSFIYDWQNSFAIRWVE